MRTKCIELGKFIDCDNTELDNEHHFKLHCFFENGVLEKTKTSIMEITFREYKSNIIYTVKELKENLVEVYG